MAWKKQLRPASFRGVAFKVATTERAGGRKTVEHEYPLRDETYVEDLGRRGRAFTVEAHVVGDDYAAKRDALLTALEAPGPGQLIHPFYGARLVAVESYRVRDSMVDDGRVARFSISFKESLGSPLFPLAVASNSIKLSDLVDRAVESIKRVFEENFDTMDRPQFVLDSAEAVLTDSLSACDSAFLTATAGTEDAAALRKQLLDFKSSAATYVAGAASKISTAMADLFDKFRKADGGADGKVTALGATYVFETDPAPAETTSTREREADNRAALIALVQQLSVVEAARQASVVEYESREAAITARATILDRLDEQAETTTDDQLFADLADVRAQLVLAVPDETQPLARLQEHVPARTDPSIVLAYDLYGHLRLELDLVARNRVRHPGFVPGGKTLQVLTDE